MQKIPMTVKGADLLREELHHLKSVERPAVIDAIAEARAHGDLKENAEYHAAREKQSFIEGRISEIDSKLSYAQIIDISQIENTGKVIFGSTVSLKNVQTEELMTYKIVGEDEANIQQGKISITSPIARAMVGKYVDDSIQVHAPQGMIEYEITDVSHV